MTVTPEGIEFDMKVHFSLPGTGLNHFEQTIVMVCDILEMAFPIQLNQQHDQIVDSRYYHDKHSYQSFEPLSYFESHIL